MECFRERHVNGPLPLFLEYPCGQSPEYVTKGPTNWDSLILVCVDEELTFIHPDDVKLYNEWDSRAFELQVANHELLGHGSGKLFEEYPDGSKNFDPEKVSKALFRIWLSFLNKTKTYAGYQSSNWAKNVRRVVHFLFIINYLLYLQFFMVQARPNPWLSSRGGIILNGGMPCRDCCALLYVVALCSYVHVNSGHTPQWSATLIFWRSSRWSLSIFNHPRIITNDPLQYTDKQEIEDIQYITFLLMARAGLRALEFYDPASGKHGQAHMQARCAAHHFSSIVEHWKSNVGSA